VESWTQVTWPENGETAVNVRSSFSLFKASIMQQNKGEFDMEME
jgi:hypothetical protein